MAEYKDIISKMTLEEKCALLSGKGTFTTRGFEKYGIPVLEFSDGTSGLRKQAGEADHLGLNESEKATCFPTGATVAQSWDEDLAEEIGYALGEETAALGVAVLLGPGLNIKRSPLGGRNFEYFSEDPYLTGKIAASYIRGIQKNGVSACPKHFAVNSQENQRMVSNSVVDERTLREIYLTGFEMAVKEGNPQTIMTSYNLVNGVYANENEHLLKDILRGDWDFDGMVVTDWGGSNDHALGVKNGSTMEMPAPGAGSILELIKAVKDGKVSESDVDERVEEALKVIFATYDAAQNRKKFSEEDHHLLAKKAAAAGLVLLKNENDILPFKSETKVALIGDFVTDPRYQGAGSSHVNPFRVDNLLDAMKDKSLKITGNAKGYNRDGSDDQKLIDEAAALAASSDAVVLMLGLCETQESEGMDRENLKLNKNQLDLLDAVSAVNQNIAVVISAGGPVETPWIDKSKALIYCCLGGQAGAGALADVLTGDAEPGGRLTESWPVVYEDTPASEYFHKDGRSAEYREGIYVGYRYYETSGAEVRFPFGFGLSYTKFEYGDLTATDDGVSLTVTNAGDREGSDVVQLYVSKKDAQVFRAAKELKAFKKVFLKPGESVSVSLKLDDKAFRYWNVLTDKWEIEGGEYELFVGSSVDNLTGSVSVSVEGTGAENPYENGEMECYVTGRVKTVPDKPFALLLTHDIPDRERTAIDRSVTLSEMDSCRSLVGIIAAKVLKKIRSDNQKANKPDLNILFLCDMPLRALAKMTSGMVDMGMVDGIVMELKGFWIIGFIRMIFAFIKNMIKSKSFEKSLE